MHNPRAFNFIILYSGCTRHTFALKCYITDLRTVTDIAIRVADTREVTSVGVGNVAFPRTSWFPRVSLLVMITLVSTRSRTCGKVSSKVEASSGTSKWFSKHIFSTPTVVCLKSASHSWDTSRNTSFLVNSAKEMHLTPQLRLNGSMSGKLTFEREKGDRHADDEPVQYIGSNDSEQYPPFDCFRGQYGWECNSVEFIGNPLRWTYLAVSAIKQFITWHLRIWPKPV